MPFGKLLPKVTECHLEFRGGISAPRELLPLPPLRERNPAKLLEEESVKAIHISVELLETGSKWKSDLGKSCRQPIMVSCLLVAETSATLFCVDLSKLLNFSACPLVSCKILFKITYRVNLWLNEVTYKCKYKLFRSMDQILF